MKILVTLVFPGLMLATPAPDVKNINDVISIKPTAYILAGGIDRSDMESRTDDSDMDTEMDTSDMDPEMDTSDMDTEMDTSDMDPEMDTSDMDPEME